ncbi:MAG: YtxH domain-containing protein [Pseudomonadota bacterium]
MKHSDTQEGSRGGIPMGAFALGALTGALAGILLAPKAGRETREDIKETLVTLKDDIAERLSELKEVTQEKYRDVVDSVIEAYKSTKELTEQQAQEARSNLEKGYEEVKEAADRMRGQVKSGM